MGANYEDWRSKYKLSLDSIFADYAAYAYWSSDEAGSCCARSVDFVGGGTRRGARSFCGFYGIRAVRSRQ